MKWFDHIWARRPSWSCDQDIANKITMPLPKEAPHKISTVSEKKIFEIVDDGRTTDGRTPDHGHPISSPCEPSAQVS